MQNDFSKITPCGGCCDECGYYQNKECRGCRAVEGKCVKMWSNGCAIYSCCVEHKVYFCGICVNFPCDWITNKIIEWDKDGIEKLKKLKIKYEERLCTM